jgi:uncharacterized protein (TIGR02996 family)
VSLLAQILANPEDPAPRLVYADELQAAGDPRGELIAIETALASKPSVELAIRRRDLRAAHAATWWPELPAHRIRSRGGFADAVALRADEVQAARALFDREPITSVELVGDAEDLDLHPRVERLALHGIAGSGTFAKICGSPLGDRLVALDCAGWYFQAKAELGDALPRCKELVLAHNYLDSELVRVMRWRHRDRLERLDLRSCRLIGPIVTDVLRHGFERLRILQLSGNPIGDGSVHELARRLDVLPALAHVELVDAEVSAEAVAVLRAARPAMTVVAESRVRPVELDLIGAVIRFEPVSERWRASVDGEEVAIRWRETTRYDNGSTRVDEDWRESRQAPLDRLAAAIAAGVPRELAPDHVKLRVSQDTGYVYNSSVYSSVTARIAWPMQRALEIDFEDYVSID